MSPKHFSDVESHKRKDKDKKKKKRKKEGKEQNSRK
jgi:hypothetical protein